MRKEVFFILLCLFAPTITLGQFTFDSIFPDSETYNNSHGLAVDQFGKVWNGPYYSELVNDGTERQSRLYIFNPDGSQASFSPMFHVTVSDTMFRFGSITGVTLSERGTIYVAMHGHRQTSSLLPGGSPNAVIGGNWNTSRGYVLELNATDGSLVSIGDITSIRVASTPTALEVAHAPNRVAVTSDGYVVVSYVFGGSPIRIFDPFNNWTVVNTVAEEKTGFSRSIEVSADGRFVFNPNDAPFSEGRPTGHIQVYQAANVFAPYSPIQPLAEGTPAGAIARYPNTDILFFSGAGVGNDPVASNGYNSSTYYGVSTNPSNWGDIITQFSWEFGGSTTYRIPRSMAFSQDGRTVYVGSFNAGTGNLQKFTLVNEFTPLTPPPNETGNTVLTLSTDKDSYLPNDIVEVYVNLDQNQQTVSNVLGTGFQIWFNNQALEYQDYSVDDNFLNGVSPSDIINFNKLVTNGSMSQLGISLSRKTSSGGVNLSGTIATVRFKVLPTFSNQIETIRIRESKVMNSEGTYLNTSENDVMITFADALVWPGDTNNDGVVDITDVLPIGVYYGSIGPARSTSSIAWNGQTASRFTVVDATFADADGDGIVNQNDVLPIGFNFGQSRQTNKSTFDSEIPFVEFPISKSGDSYILTVEMDELPSLLGVAFQFEYNDLSDLIQIASPNIAQSLMTDNSIDFSVSDSENGVLGVAYSRTASETLFKLESNSIEFEITVLKDITSVDNLHLSRFSYSTDSAFFYPKSTLSLAKITSVQQELTIPSSLQLSQNYPNPFNPNTLISFDLPQSGFVSLSVYNLLGQRVATVINSELDAGSHSISFDATSLSSGVYIYRLSSDAGSISRTMTLIK